MGAELVRHTRLPLPLWIRVGALDGHVVRVLVVAVPALGLPLGDLKSVGEHVLVLGVVMPLVAQLFHGVAVQLAYGHAPPHVYLVGQARLVVSAVAVLWVSRAPCVADQFAEPVGLLSLVLACLTVTFLVCALVLEVASASAVLYLYVAVVWGLAHPPLFRLFWQRPDTSHTAARTTPTPTTSRHSHDAVPHPLGGIDTCFLLYT